MLWFFIHLGKDKNFYAKQYMYVTTPKCKIPVLLLLTTFHIT